MKEQLYAVMISFSAGDLDYEVKGIEICDERTRAIFQMGIDIACRYVQAGNSIYICFGDNLEDAFYDVKKIQNAFVISEISEEECNILKKFGIGNDYEMTMPSRFFEYFECIGLEATEGEFSEENEQFKPYVNVEDN